MKETDWFLVHFRCDFLKYFHSSVIHVSTVPEYLFTDSVIQGMANSVLEKEENIP